MQSCGTRSGREIIQTMGDTLTACSQAQQRAQTGPPGSQWPVLLARGQLQTLASISPSAWIQNRQSNGRSCTSRGIGPRRALRQRAQDQRRLEAPVALRTEVGGAAPPLLPALQGLRRGCAPGARSQSGFHRKGPLRICGLGFIFLNFVHLGEGSG